MKSPDSRRTVKLLRLLSADELSDLLEFSDYACKRQKFPHRYLLVELSKYFPDFPQADLEAWEEKYEDKFLNKALSALNGIIEEFLALQGVRIDTVQKYQYIIDRLSNTPEEAFFQHYIKKIEESIQEQPVDIHGLYREYRLQLEALAHWYKHQYDLQVDIYGKVARAYRKFTRGMFLKHECGKWGNENLFTLPEGYTPDADQLASEKPNAFVDLLEMVYDLFSNPNHEIDVLLQVVEKFKANISEITPIEGGNFFKLFLNFCNVKYKEGNAAYLKVIYDLNQWAKKEKIPAGHRDGSLEDYFNECLLIGAQGNLEEMETYIYSKASDLLLLEETKIEAINLMLAFLAFLRNETEKSLGYVLLIKNQKHIFGLRVQSLLIRLHYDIGLETGQFETTKRALDNYRKYFERKEMISVTRRINYMKLHYFVNKMVTRKINEHKKDIKIENLDLLNELDSLKEDKPIGFEWVKKRLKNER